MEDIGIYRTSLCTIPLGIRTPSKLMRGERTRFAVGDTIRINTMEREYGSGAAAIAEKVAARLGWKPWDQLLKEQIARLPRIAKVR
jgi:hypothetical protein